MAALIALAAAPVAALVIAVLLRSPLARRIVAHPTGERWHQTVTPTFGGVGIFVGLAAAAAAALASGALHPSRQAYGILGGFAILFLAGLYDDVRALPPLAKIAAQGAAAAAVIGCGVRVEVVGNEVAATVLGVVWIVGMTNAFNLLDNMDGLASSLAGIAAVFFAVDAVTIHPDRLSLVVSIALAAACAGFLPFNLRLRSKALVFMGDSGSQVLGFGLGVLGLLTSWKVAETTVATLLVPVLVLAVPILDTALVTVVRLLEGRPVTQGGRDHTSHRLVYRGLSEKRAVVLLALVSAGLGGTSLAYTVLGDTRVTLVGVLLTFAGLVQFAGFLGDLQAADGAHGGRALAMRRLVLQRRRLIEMLVDFALIIAAFLAAYLMRVDGAGTTWQRSTFNVALPPLLIARFLCFIPFGLYRGVWRYASAQDAVRVAGAVVVSEAAAYGYLEVAGVQFGGFSRDIFLIDALLCTIVVGSYRFGERALVRLLQVWRGRGQQRRTLVVGAGRSGRSLVRELRESPGESVVGFVDDDARLHRRRLAGVVVLGGSADLDRILAQARPDSVLVTIPSAPREVLDDIVRQCSKAGVPCRFVRRELDLDPVAVLGVAAE